MKTETKKNINVFLVGLAFLLVFTAFQTMSNLQPMVLDFAANKTSDGYVQGFSGDGYISLAIIYIVSAVFNWLAPAAMVFFGLKITMILGAVTYALFIASFFYLDNALLYSASGLIGVGAALIWTAQGAFLTVNSDSRTMARNSGIFWAMLECSLIIGNSFAYTQFSGKEDISEDERTFFVAILCGIAVAGVLVFFLLLPTPWAEKENVENPMEAVTNAFVLFGTWEMIQLVFYFFYMGMELTFWSGVYGPSLANTGGFDDPAGLNGLHGIMIGVGEIVGGLIFGIFGYVTNIFGRFPVVLLGTVTQFAAFVLIALNLPNDAPIVDSVIADTSVIDPPNVAVALICSLLLGFGDACYNTQTLSLLGNVYPDKAGQAFAIFKFVQCVAAAAGFGYAGYIPLYWHIGMMIIMGTFGTIFFIKIDLETTKKDKKNQAIISGGPEEPMDYMTGVKEIKANSLFIEKAAPVQAPDEEAPVDKVKEELSRQESSSSLGTESQPDRDGVKDEEALVRKEEEGMADDDTTEEIKPTLMVGIEPPQKLESGAEENIDLQSTMANEDSLSNKSLDSDDDDDIPENEQLAPSDAYKDKHQDQGKNDEDKEAPVIEEDEVKANDDSEPSIVQEDQMKANDDIEPSAVQEDPVKANDDIEPSAVQEDQVKANDDIEPSAVKEDQVKANDDIEPSAVQEDQVKANDDIEPSAVKEDQVKANDDIEPSAVQEDQVKANDDIEATAVQEDQVKVNDDSEATTAQPDQVKTKKDTEAFIHKGDKEKTNKNNSDAFAVQVQNRAFDRKDSEGSGSE